MKKGIQFLLMVVAFALVFNINNNAYALFGKDKTEAEKQEEGKQEKADIRKMVNETLSRLYKLQPGAKSAISKSAGYAVFNNFGTKILVVGGGTGKGILFDKKNNKEVFMRMIEAQAGLGMGIKKFSVIFVFDKQSHVDSFVNSGWEFGGQATAAAKMGEEGGAFAGAMSVSPGVWMYQLADDGLAVELTGKGTKYYKDDDLN
ncbi:MAG: YSC84-related protein [Desulfobulbaceae bacterium]|jgi:lipid-binding SYLF domain-containing protein|nr:YSC84-related protein [Desulfobulbaceae bacterium]MDH3775432.1 YSC84-related protein [Desulfobulbaceae bacterium]